MRHHWLVHGNLLDGVQFLPPPRIKIDGQDLHLDVPHLRQCRFAGPQSIWLRGIIYTVCIYLTEFFTGSFLKKYNLCPWDYSKAKLNYKGLVRLDYLPLWFLTGLLYEKVLCKDVKS